MRYRSRDEECNQCGVFVLFFLFFATVIYKSATEFSTNNNNNEQSSYSNVDTSNGAISNVLALDRRWKVWYGGRRVEVEPCTVVINFSIFRHNNTDKYVNSSPTIVLPAIRRMYGKSYFKDMLNTKILLELNRLFSADNTFHHHITSDYLVLITKFIDGEYLREEFTSYKHIHFFDALGNNILLISNNISNSNPYTPNIHLSPYI